MKHLFEKPPGKKLLALLLTVIMVLSVVPAMALLSSAAETFELGTYGTGAETWSNGGRPQTQLLVGVPTEIWNAYTQEVTWTKISYGDTTTAPSLVGGRIEFTVTDLDNTKTVLTCVPSSSTSFNGKVLLHMMTAEYASPKMPIEIGNTYTVSDVKLYVGNTVKYQSSNRLSCSWKAGAKAPLDAIYVNGVKANPQPTFTPKVDPYDKPITADYLHSGFIYGSGSDFEAHDSFGKNMLLAIPADKIVNTGDLDHAVVKITMNGKTTAAEISSTIGTFLGMDDENNETEIPCVHVRIRMDEFPDAGTYADSRIEILNKDSGKVMYTGTLNILSAGDTNAGPADMTKYPVYAELTAYTDIDGETGEKKSDWEVWKGNFVLLVVMHNIVSQKDLKWNKTTFEVELDGKAAEGDVLDSIYDYPNAADDGSYSSILRLSVGTPTEGRHKVKVTVKYDGVVLYQTGEFEVVYAAESTNGANRGDANGDGAVNSADRTYLARHLAGWDGYTLEGNKYTAADLTGDGTVNSADRTYLARALAGWDGYTL